MSTRLSCPESHLPHGRPRPQFPTPFRSAVALALLASSCNLSNQHADTPSDSKTATSEAAPQPTQTETKKAKNIWPSLDQEHPDFEISLPEAVMLRAEKGLLPPPECVNTGWVYFDGEGDYPSSMTIRTACEQVFELGVLAYPGKGVTVNPDAQGRFLLPYENTYVVIKEGMPVIVYPYQGEYAERDLVPDDQESRLFSYAPYRRQGYLTPIIEEEDPQKEGGK